MDAPDVVCRDQSTRHLEQILVCWALQIFVLQATQFVPAFLPADRQHAHKIPRNTWVHQRTDCDIRQLSHKSRFAYPECNTNSYVTRGRNFYVGHNEEKVRSESDTDESGLWDQITS